MKSNRTTLARVWCLLFALASLSIGNAYAQVEYHSSKTNDVEDESSITVLKPDGVEPGDFLFVTITNSRANEIQAVKLPDDGWMLVKKSDAGSNFGIISYYKIAGADEPESYEFSFYSNLEMTLPRNGTFIINISRFSGIDPINPFQIMADNLAKNASSKNVIAPSVTTTKDSTYVLVLFGIDEDDGFDPSDTYIKLYNYEVTKIAKQTADGSDETQTDNIDLSVLLGWFFQETADATGTRTAVSSDKAGWWAAQTLALNGAPKAPQGGRYVSDDPEQVGDGTAETPYELTYGTPLGDLSPVFDSGDAPTSYVLSTSTVCQLPTGLNLSATTGVIDGTPLVTIDDCALTVEASNDFGTTTVTVYIDVLPRPLTITGAFTANNKQVDGTRSATFATNELELANVYDDDDVQLIDLVILFDDAGLLDVMQPVQISSADLGGAQEMYYTLSLTGAPTTEAMITSTNPPVGGRYVSDDPEQVGDGTAETPYELTYGTPLGDLSPVFDSGDAPTSYVLSTSTVCQLPTGLNLSATTGVIDGTPLVTIDDCALTVEASNDFGTTTVTVYIDVLPRPLTITGAFTANNKQVDGTRSATFATNELELANVYDDDDVQLIDLVILFDDAGLLDVMQPVQISSADLGGAKEMYYTLSLTGAPTTEAMITSTNPPVGGRYVSDDPEQGGDGSESEPFLFTLGEDISTLSPVFTGGGAATAFEIFGETACPLPQGLSLNASNGLITGTPTATAEGCAVTVIASNDDGSTAITTYMTILEVVLPGGSVTGLVFEDNDASGTQESSESGFEGVTVQLFAGATLVLSTTTDEDGAFSFPDVPVGSYTMNILLPEEYYESIPGPDIGGSYAIDVESEQQLSDYLFGIFQEAGVFGAVFDASTAKLMRLAGLNQDLPSGITITGVRTEPEATKASAVSKIAENQVLSSTFTVGIDENGAYELDKIVPGNYVMTIDVPAPWVVITTNPVDVALKDKVMTEVNFGILIEEIIRDESSITGYVSASNAVPLSAKQNSDIPKLMLDSIRVELSGTSTLDETISRFTFTDEEGMYTFLDLPPGTYTVEIKPSNTFSYDWPMHKKYSIELGNEAEVGAKKGEEKPIVTVDPNVDRGVALVSILIDTNLDGIGDRRVDLTTDWFLELKGLPSQQVRDLGLEAMAGFAYNPDGSLLNGLVNPSSPAGTLERVNGTDAQLSFNTGLILEQNEIILVAEQNLRFTGLSQVWPIRDQVFTLANPVNLSDPFGVLKGRILTAELRPMYGLDFNLELADYGDAPQTHGTNRARVTTQGRVQNRLIHYPMDGPRHLLPLNGAPQLYLGSFVNAEADGVPSAAANSAADDDGLVLPDSTAQGGTAEITLTLKGSGLLSGWVDWNQNGVFDETEIVWEDVSVSADAMGAPQLVGFVVPETALVGTAVMRVRLTTQSGVGPNGLAWNGEVEDYLFVVTKKSSGDGGGGPTSDPKDETLPGEYRLGLNYPNPFNPSTMIPFELAQTGQVRIDIYDVTGRLIETIVNEVMTAGKHTIAFNAKDYPSGVYVIRMNAGGVVRSGKLTLVK